MGVIPADLRDISIAVNEEHREVCESVRELLSWFGSQRRGFWVVKEVNDALLELGLKTEPNFETVWLDQDICFLPLNVASPQVVGIVDGIMVEDNTVSLDEPVSLEVISEPLSLLSIPDPTYRISRLEAATRPPISVSPDHTVEKAITLMLSNDFSQLPVTTSDREVKGMISWRSIGSHHMLGKECKFVRDCMEQHYEISAEASIFDAIETIVRRDYLLIRSSDKKISGIITTSDLSLQFRQLGEPFLLLGEIENQIRRLIDGKFTTTELSTGRDPGDTSRLVNNVADLTFGEYVRLLQRDSCWSKVKLQVDKNIFVENLQVVNRIRNDVMHFDPDGIVPEDLDVLRNTVKFMQTLSDVGVL